MLDQVLVFIIILLAAYAVYSQCTFSCKGLTKPEDQKMYDQLQNQKDNGDVEEIDIDELMKKKEEGKLGPIEMEDKKEGYYPYNLYSGYAPYYYYPAYYQGIYYPRRRYLRPYYRGYYGYGHPGRWYRHAGRYYFVHW